MQCVDANNVSRKVYFCERGNLMTAINYFRKITGRSFDIGIPAAPGVGGRPGGARTATSSSPSRPVKALQFNTHSDQIGSTNVTVTLRGGGSSSPVTTEPYVLTSGDDKGLMHYTHDLPGVPTMEFQNAFALTAVDEFHGIGNRIVEVKFTARSEFVSTKETMSPISRAGAPRPPDQHRSIACPKAATPSARTS